MPDSARFALHRPECWDALVRGEEKIIALMSGSAQRLPPGSVLVQANTEHEYVYRLIEGWASRTRRLPDRRKQRILIFLPGDLFAVKSMFVTVHSDAIDLLSESVVERVHYRVLHRAYVEDADVASRCIWQVMEEERRLHDWVVGLGQGSAEERVALLLVDFQGRLAAAGRIAPDALAFPMPISQVQLADYLGITPVHLNRVLRLFRDRNIATLRDKRVTLSSLEALSRCAYPLLDVHERTRPAYVGSPHVEP